MAIVTRVDQWLGDNSRGEMPTEERTLYLVVDANGTDLKPLLPPLATKAEAIEAAKFLAFNNGLKVAVVRVEYLATMIGAGAGMRAIGRRQPAHLEDEPVAIETHRLRLPAEREREDVIDAEFRATDE